VLLIRNVYPGRWIPDPNFSIPDPRVKKIPDPDLDFLPIPDLGSRIRNTEIQENLGITPPSSLFYHA
jgi:hypothetical protein